LKKELGFTAPGEEWADIVTVKKLIDFVLAKK
jgi:acyl carrier protein